MQYKRVDCMVCGLYFDEVVFRQLMCVCMLIYGFSFCVNSLRARRSNQRLLCRRRSWERIVIFGFLVEDVVRGIYCGRRLEERVWGNRDQEFFQFVGYRGGVVTQVVRRDIQVQVLQFGVNLYFSKVVLRRRQYFRFGLEGQRLYKMKIFSVGISVGGSYVRDFVGVNVVLFQRSRRRWGG